MRSLTIRQPWGTAIAHLGKTVENRGWQTYYRGPIAIHAGTGVGSKWEYENALEAVAARSGLEPEGVRRLSAVRGAVIAVAQLADVCSASLHLSFAADLACECGPWAQTGQRHFLLTGVRSLSAPVPALGAQQFWTLPDEVEAAVVAQLPKVSLDDMCGSEVAR